MSGRNSHDVKKKRQEAVIYVIIFENSSQILNSFVTDHIVIEVKFG